MLESDMMTHLDTIEKAAQFVALPTRRENFRSLQVIQIQGPSGNWCTFDPIHSGKDLAKFLWHLSRKKGIHENEVQFRKDLLEEMMRNDHFIS